MSSKKLPAMQFYVGDWRKDGGIQSLDYFSRGVWFEMLCFMHESEDRGKLLLNGKPMPVEALAQSLGLGMEQTQEVVKKLIAYGVCGYDMDAKLICNRRMMRDEAMRQTKTEAGRRGGIAKAKNLAEGLADSQQKPTPSVSSSVSTSPSVNLNAVAREETNLDANEEGRVVGNLLDAVENLELYRDDGVLLDSLIKLVPQWMSVFKGVDIVQEVRKAHLWELSSPRNRKKNRPKFLSNWLSSAHGKLYTSDKRKPSRAISQASEVSGEDAQMIADMAKREESNHG